MLEQRKAASPHKMIIDGRETAQISGVLELVSSDESAVVAETEQGVITIKGANLHVSNFNLDNGQLDIDGEMNSFTYEDSDSFGKNKGSFLSKIFK